MAAFVIQRAGEDTLVVEGADTYAPEGALTTFFATRGQRGMVDSWAERVASFRTAGIISIERVDAPACDNCGQGTYAPVSASAHRPIDSAPATAYTAGSSRSRRSSTTAAAIANGNALVA